MKGSMRYVASALEPRFWPRSSRREESRFPKSLSQAAPMLANRASSICWQDKKASRKSHRLPEKRSACNFFVSMSDASSSICPAMAMRRLHKKSAPHGRRRLIIICNTRASLKLLLLLLDIRRIPSSDDRNLLLMGKRSGNSHFAGIHQNRYAIDRRVRAAAQPGDCLLSPEQPIETLNVPDSRKRIWSILLRYI